MSIPAALRSVANSDEHFDYIIDDIGRDAAFFGYLKNYYFTLPAMQKRPASYPVPEHALLILGSRAASIQEGLSEVLRAAGTPGATGAEAAVPRSAAELPPALKQWFYMKGAQAWGKRVVNKSELGDGGTEYLSIFRQSALLAAYPELFGALVQDFCLVAPRPLGARRDIRIWNARESSLALLPHFLALDRCLPREPRLSRLYGVGLYREEVLDTLARLDADNTDSFPYLRRAALLLSDCRRGDRMEFAVESRRYLELALAHADFRKLPADEQSLLEDRLLACLVAVGEIGEALARQERLGATGRAGRAPALALCAKGIAQLERRLAAEAGKEKGTDGPDLREELAKLTEKRDALLREALADLSCRSDTVPVARTLQRLTRDRECIDYLERFLDGDATADLDRLNAVVILAGCLVDEAKRIEKAQAGQGAGAAAPATSANAGGRDAGNSGRERALAVLRRIDPADYESRRDMETRAALHAWRRLGQRIEAALAIAAADAPPTVVPDRD